MQIQQANKPLPVFGTANLRELGGYYTTDGRITKTHVFLRSDELHDIDENGREFLHNYGLNLDVDLRDEIEILAAPDEINRRNVKYDHIPLFSKIEADIVKDELERKKELIPHTMSELYIDILENQKKSILKAVTALIKDDKCSLFHCTNGKDRTGVIAMLLLGAVGVPDGTIVADYAASAKYREGKLEEEQKKYERFEKMGVIPDSAFESKPEFMQKTLEYLNSNYKNALNYLTQIGLSEKLAGRLSEKFTAAV